MDRLNTLTFTQYTTNETSAPLNSLRAGRTQPEHIGQMLPHLLPELVLLDELLEFLSQLHVLLPQLAVVRVVLLHLDLDLIECHLEVQRRLLAPLLILPEPLSVLLLPSQCLSG